MKLSLILCSRNDNYQGNSRWRLEAALDYVTARVAELGRTADVEVIVADWGSDVPLADTIPLTAEASQMISFLWVPPAVARAKQKDSSFPEVLALNAAARRARGEFVGRIDQDTLVGGRFLRTFFDLVEGRERLENGVPVESALLFANRRCVPYRFVQRMPSRGDIERFIHRFGSRLEVWRWNAATGHVFWTSFVGIWLAHRRIWEEAGGYDERMIYYNWMESDMIWRLRPQHAVVDLGVLTGQDFYHLEHDVPRKFALEGRPRRRNNPTVDLSASPTVLRPNGDGWGLTDVSLSLSRGRKQKSREEHTSWPLLLAGLAGEMAADRAAVIAMQQARKLRRYHPRKVLPEVLSRTGLLGETRRLQLRARLFSDADLRRTRREDSDRFFRFSREGAGAIRTIPGASRGRTALVVSARCPTIEGELCLIKALQLAGLTPVVLLEDERRGLRPFYEMAGVARVRLWSEFLTSRNCAREAARVVSRCESVNALMDYTEDGIRVGMIAVCTALRRMRVGVLDWTQPAVRQQLASNLAASMCAALEARDILAAFNPAVVLTPPEYTPHGELFETCVAAGIDTIAHDHAQRVDAVVLKRYTTLNRDRHLTTMSDRSWSTLQGLEWTQKRAGELHTEMAAAYQAGDWYGTRWVAGAPTDPREVTRALGLNSNRPIAAIFPHMLWDAPVMWGQPVFATYQDWLVETVRAAYNNSRVNWVLKIHPAHVRKQAPGRMDEPTEVAVIREALGPFPPHVKCLMPETPVSTLALLGAIDYCFTVRGTVGVEAARLGLPVFTAGPARYSGLGFTIDSDSQAQYLERLSAIERTPRLSDSEKELAERFAYGLFVLRPLRLTSMVRDPHDPERVRIGVRAAEDWPKAPDVSALARWFVSQDEDFLHPA